MDLDLKKMSIGQFVGLGAGLLLFLNLFLPWFKEGDFYITVASSTFAWFISLAGLLGAVVLLSKISFGPIKGDFIAIGLGGLATLLALLKLIIGHELGGQDIGRNIGIFFGLLGSGAVAAGGVLGLLMDGGFSFGSAKPPVQLGEPVQGQQPPVTPGEQQPPPPPPPPGE
jgi:hypothetical protein